MFYNDYKLYEGKNNRSYIFKNISYDLNVNYLLQETLHTNIVIFDKCH